MCKFGDKRKAEWSDRPLTEEERKFAEDYHCAIYYFMKDNHLDQGEWYDVLVIPYLQAVKKYHCNLEVQQYSFHTVCNAVLLTALGNHKRAKRRQCRRPEGGIVSLDYTMQGDHLFDERHIEELWIDTKQQVEQQILDKETLALIFKSLDSLQTKIFSALLEGYTKTAIQNALDITEGVIYRQMKYIKDVTYTVLYRD